MKKRIMIFVVMALFSFATVEAADLKAVGLDKNTGSSRIQKNRLKGKLKTMPADLKVVQADMVPNHPKVGTNITFKARIYNAGFQQAPPSKAIIRVGGETNGHVYAIPALAARASHEISRTIALGVVQNYRTTIIADSANQVTEGLENNNQVQLNFHVRNQEISSRFVDVHFDPNVGTNGRWWVTIENTGTETIGYKIEASYPDAGGMFYEIISLPSEAIHATSPPQNWFSAKAVNKIRFRLYRRLGPNHYTALLDEKVLTVTH